MRRQRRRGGVGVRRGGQRGGGEELEQGEKEEGGGKFIPQSSGHKHATIFGKEAIVNTKNLEMLSSFCTTRMDFKSNDKCPCMRHAERDLVESKTQTKDVKEKWRHRFE